MTNDPTIPRDSSGVPLVAPGRVAPVTTAGPQLASGQGGPTMASLRAAANAASGFPTRPAAAGLAEPERIATAFVVLLRGAGLALPVGATVTFTEALGTVGISRRSGVYWAGRATLVRKPEDLVLYERVFNIFWDGLVTAGSAPGEQQSVSVAFDELPDGEEPESPSDQDPDDEDNDTLAVRYSNVEVLAAKDFAAYTHDDFIEAARLIAQLRTLASPRRSRRMRTTYHRTRRPDIRRTVRLAMRTDGTPVRRAYLEHSERPRRLVLLLDVSGSMESYARALMRFAQAAVVGRGRVEVFAIGTRLTRLTRELSSRDPDRALTQAAAHVADWSGGTRLGDGLRAFNDQWGIRGMARGAVVVILSDGWDRGDPAVLGAQVARLHRVTHRLVWVNPLKAAPGYAPLARGMAAALPHLDEFVEGHSLDSLAELARIIAG